MIDVAAVPDGLEDSVGKTERQDVLHGLFAQVVIDAVDLFFVGDLQQLLVQRLGRLEIVSEGLLDDYPPPVPLFCSISPAAASFSTMGPKKLGRGRQVVEVIPWVECSLSIFSEQSFNAGVRSLSSSKSAGKIVKAAREPFPEIGVNAFPVANCFMSS